MIHRDIALRRYRRAPACKGIRLADVAGFVNRDGQTAVRHRRRMQRNAIAHHHRAGTRVKHHAGADFLCLHLYIIQLRHKCHPRAGAGGRTHGDVGGTLRRGNAAKRGVDRRRNVVGVFKRRAFQVERDGVAHLKIAGDLALHRRAVGN